MAVIGPRQDMKNGIWASHAVADRASRLPLRVGAAMEAGLHCQAMWAAIKHR